MKFLHLNYHCHLEQIDPLWVIEKHKFASGFIDPLSRQVDFLSVKHMDFEGRVTWAGINYHFFQEEKPVLQHPLEDPQLYQKTKTRRYPGRGFCISLPGPSATNGRRTRLPDHRPASC